MPIELTTLLETLDRERTVILATCAGKRVTIRPMSHIRRGCDIYFQTGENSLKMRQIAENPSVAIACGTFEIEGEAAPQGRPLGDPWFAKAYRTKHPEPFARYSALPNEIIVKVTIRCVRQWQYVDGNPFLAEIEL